MNVDICAAVFHPDGSLLDYVVKILGKRNVEELRRGINDNERRNLERVIILNKVVYNYCDLRLNILCK